MNVQISVKTLVQSENGPDSMEFVTDGSYTYGDDAIRFEYMESELTGLSGTRTLFTVTRDEVIMTREGQVNTQVMYRPGEKNYFAYSTPMGMITIGLSTSSITNRLGAHGGTLQLNYTVDVQGAARNRNEVVINVKEVI